MLYSWEHCNEIIDYVKVDVVRGQEVLIFKTLWTDGETRSAGGEFAEKYDAVSMLWQQWLYIRVRVCVLCRPDSFQAMFCGSFARSFS